MWKRLHHPNIVPFLGVPAKLPPFEIVCDWMKNGRINDYLRNHPQEDRISLVSELVSISAEVIYISKCLSSGMWRKAFTTYIHVKSSTVT